MNESTIAIDSGTTTLLSWPQAEVEKKTAMLMEVKRHLREAAERERAFKTATGDSQVRTKQLNQCCTRYTYY